MQTDFDKLGKIKMCCKPFLIVWHIVLKIERKCHKWSSRLKNIDVNGTIWFGIAKNHNSPKISFHIRTSIVTKLVCQSSFISHSKAMILQINNLWRMPNSYQFNCICIKHIRGLYWFYLWSVNAIFTKVFLDF